MKIGDKVTLTARVMRAQLEPEKYETGIVTYIGSWKCVGVKFNGIDHEITVLSDELELIEE